MPVKKLSRVIKNEKEPWSGIAVGHYFGNWNATENVIGDNHLWIKVSCNDPICDGIKAVHSSVLKKA
jgi:hypothetical protein